MSKKTILSTTQWKEDIHLTQQGNIVAFLRLQQSFASLLRYETKKLLRHAGRHSRGQTQEYNTVFQAVILNFFHFIDEFRRFDQPSHRIPGELQRYLQREERYGRPHIETGCCGNTAKTENTGCSNTNRQASKTGKPPHGPDMAAYAAKIENYKIISPQFPQHIPYGPQSLFHMYRQSKERYLSLHPFPWKNRLYIRFCVKETNETEPAGENIYKVRVIIFLLK